MIFWQGDFRPNFLQSSHFPSKYHQIFVTNSVKNCHFSDSVRTNWTHEDFDILLTKVLDFEQYFDASTLPRIPLTAKKGQISKNRTKFHAYDTTKIRLSNFTWKWLLDQLL